MNIEFLGLPTDEVAKIRRNQVDAYGLKPETNISQGSGTPCRHCLKDTPSGAEYLVLAHRPFRGLNAYCETGPIFLCADDCQPADPVPNTPPMLGSDQYIVRGYSSDERILYGTGQIVETDQIPEYARALLRNNNVAFVDIRSATNNCFQCRVQRSP